MKHKWRRVAEPKPAQPAAAMLLDWSLLWLWGLTMFPTDYDAEFNLTFDMLLKLN